MSKPAPPFEKPTSREELKARYDGVEATPLGLPVNWTDGETGKTHFQTRLATPDAHERMVFGSPRAQTCGNCKYFDLENGRVEILRQRFAEKLVREYEWKMKHLGAPPDAIGLCGASAGGGGGDLMAVTFVSAACDQFRLKG